jgi:hypothetical protein
MHLFFLHDVHFFDQRLSPALAASLRKRSFVPLSELARELEPVIEAFGQQYHLTTAERPLVLECANTQFDRRLWRHFAGELLLYAAAETPEFPTAPELLGQFLPLELVERLHRGSRDVTFDGVPYRPDRAGLHGVCDVAELAATLAAIDSSAWTVDALSHLANDERDEELAFARQCLERIRAMMAGALANGRVIVCEAV